MERFRKTLGLLVVPRLISTDSAAFFIMYAPATATLFLPPYANPGSTNSYTQ